MAGPIFMRALGLEIAQERRARGLSQRDLAAAARIHPLSVSKIERAAQKDVGVNTLDRIARALAAASPKSPINASDLLGGAAARWRSLRSESPSPASEA